MNDAPHRLLAVAAFATLATAATAALAGNRWYTADQVERGRGIYQRDCAACHGPGGQGQPDWQQRDAMGFYPAPPLNADGHAWHHPLAQMLQTLETGGGPLGGTMPSFIDVLGEDDRRAVIAYVQSLWPDAMYAQWAAIDAGTASAPAEPQNDH